MLVFTSLLNKNVFQACIYSFIFRRKSENDLRRSKSYKTRPRILTTLFPEENVNDVPTMQVPVKSYKSVLLLYSAIIQMDD